MSTVYQAIFAVWALSGFALLALNPTAAFTNHDMPPDIAIVLDEAQDRDNSEIILVVRAVAKVFGQRHFEEI